MIIKNMSQIQYGCRNKRLQKRGINYVDYLKSDQWEKVKNYMSKLEDFKKCAVCGSVENLNIHHKTYRKMFSSKMKVQKNYLVCLCRDCHNEVHKLAQENNYGLGQGFRIYRRKYKKNYG